MRAIPALAGLLLLAASSGVFAAEPPAIPEQVDLKRYEDVPEPWRDYLLQTRAAERITDPLQRCLAFPDIPGNRWPAGHAAAHCRFHFAHKALSLAEIEAMLEGGNAVKLEGLMDASLQRHFSEQDFSEDIDNAFDAFIASPESDRVSAKWLELAPKSAYANLARGEFLSFSALDARGGKFAAETPRANLRRMSELVGEAIPYLEKALSINPKLMPAYVELVNIGTADSREDVESGAFERAKEIDPACVEVARMWMMALEPRWGGDYERMLGYANDLKQYVPRRPQLAMHVEKPFSDRGDVLIRDDQYTKSTLDVLDTAVAIGSNEDALRDAADVALNSTDVKPDYWKGIAYLLQESRFRESNAWGDRRIAWALGRMEPEWSLRYALRAVALDPDNAQGHYLAGGGYNATMQFTEADREYRIAINDPKERQASLREVIMMWLGKGASEGESARKADVLRAKPYLDQLLQEYPDDGRGLLMDLQYRMVFDHSIDMDRVKAVLKKIDRADPWQTHAAARLEDFLKQVQAQAPKPKSH